MFSISELLGEQQLIYFLSALMIVNAVGVSLVLTIGKRRADYGRYSNTGSASGFFLPARVAWFLQEAPALVIPVAFICLGQCKLLSHKENAVAIILYLVHYIHRALIYPFLIHGGKPSPVHLVVMAAIFCAVNGYMQSRYHCQYAFYQNNHNMTALALAGIAIFFIGLTINIHSDHTLRSLRKPGETKYHIPQGGMFNYVSGANFFGEIVEWLGFALYAQSIPAVAFAIFTAANIGPRALHHHQFYREKFEDYPKNRKALIPFIL